MAKSRQVPCRVCGKLFTPCNKTSRELGIFNWREVACSPQCGMEYLDRVTAARGKESGGSGQEEAE